MVRDSRRDLKYFQEALDHTDQSISRYLMRLNQPEKLSPLGRMGGSAGLCRMVVDRLEYSFSAGIALNDTEHYLRDLLKYRQLQQYYADELPEEDKAGRVQWENLTISNYRSTLLWLAFAVGVGANVEYLKKLFDLVDNKGLDILYDRIAVKLGDKDRPVANKLLYPKPYKLLLDAVDASGDQQAELMNKFMDAWYPAFVKEGFYETHNITNNFGYAGYWCFEAALVTMVFGLDDTHYRNHQYYPAALVHGD